MRRFLLSLAVLSLVMSACGDDVEYAVVGSTTSSPVPPTTNLVPTSTSTTTTAPSTTTTTTVPVQGMCGDLIPVVTEFGTNCVDPAVPTTTTPDSTGFPQLLVAEDGEFFVYTYGDGILGFEGSLSTDLLVTAVQQAADGTIFTSEQRLISESETVVEIVRYERDGTRRVLDELVEIYDVGVIDGVDVVIGAVPSPDGFGFGGVRALAVDDLSEVADFGLRAEAEFGVTDFMWSNAAGVGVASAWSDLTEWVGFVDVAGNKIALPSPTDELAYNSPPYVTAATVSLDGTTLYWVEGPDWGFDEQTAQAGPVAAPWILRGADLRTGEERLFWPLSDSVLDATELNITSIEDLGGWILVNRSVLRGTTEMSLAPLVLDLTVEEPELFEFPAIGVATRAEG